MFDEVPLEQGFPGVSLVSSPFFSTISPFDHIINGLCAPPEVCYSSGLQNDIFIRFDHENSRRLFVTLASSHSCTVPDDSLPFTSLHFAVLQKAYNIAFVY